MSGTLTSADSEMFARFGITTDLLGRAGVHRVTDTEARRELGISPDRLGEMTGIVFPYPDPVDGHWGTQIAKRSPRSGAGRQDGEQIPMPLWGQPTFVFPSWRWRVASRCNGASDFRGGGEVSISDHHTRRKRAAEVARYCHWRLLGLARKNGTRVGA